MNYYMEKKILVSIQCLVYNHEPYLRQCLDGLVMQKRILNLKQLCMMIVLRTILHQ